MPDDRRRIPPKSTFEEQVGFTRAVRTGDRILVAGTIGTGEDGHVVPGGAGAQADRAFELIRSYIEELGGRMEHLVRVRMFVTNIADADAVSAAFTRHCACATPTGTLVAIAALYRPEMLVEIEAEAVVQDD